MSDLLGTFTGRAPARRSEPTRRHRNRLRPYEPLTPRSAGATLDREGDVTRPGIAETSEAEPGMRGLWFGILVYRWAALVWMTAAALSNWGPIDDTGLATTALIATVAWNVWFSLTKGWLRSVDRLIDLAIAFALLPIAGLVMADRRLFDELFFATTYPAAAALTMGAATGVIGGLLAGLALSVGLVLSRVTN